MVRLAGIEPTTPWFVGKFGAFRRLPTESKIIEKIITNQQLALLLKKLPSDAILLSTLQSYRTVGATVRATAG